MPTDPTKTATTSNLSSNSEVVSKPGLLARASSWAVSNPVKSTVGISAATTGAIKGVSWGVGKAKDYFADKTAEQTKEQAANLVSGTARSFFGKFGK